MPEAFSVVVFCGASTGHDPIFRIAATTLGAAIAEAGMRLVYGGGRVGLMGAVADGAIGAGGQVIGVIPDFLARWEVAHDGVSELIVTDSMHTRKRRMFELADAFVSFPGGLGTFDETFEVLTWRQLRLHDKPILLCDVAGSAGLIEQALDAVIARGFARPDIRALYERHDGVAATMARLSQLGRARGGAAALL